MKSDNYFSDKLARGEARQTTLLFTITAAKTYKNHNANAALVSADAITDAAIAAFLGKSSSPFAAAAFDATAMGNDTFGGVVDFADQVAELIGFEAELLEITAGPVKRGCEASADLTASTLTTECAMKGGNVGFKVNFGNTPDFDAITAGMIKVTFYWRSK